MLRGIALLVLTGCAATKRAWLPPLYSEQEIERHRFAVGKGDDVIGRLAITRVENGETLPDWPDTSVWELMPSAPPIRGWICGGRRTASVSRCP